MKRIIFFLLAVLAVVPVSAQTVATTGTITENLGATDTFMIVSSNSGLTVGNQVFIDSEQLQITSISGTTVGIRRGLNGTAARAHDDDERFIAGAADHFRTNDPDFGSDCTRGAGQAAFSPWVNVRTGTVWMCGGSGQGGLSGLAWTATNTAPVTFNSIPTSF